MPKPNHSITRYFLKDLIPNLCLPVHTGKKRNSKSKTQNVPTQKNFRLLPPLPLSASSHQYNPVLCKSFHICCSCALYGIHETKAECETITVTTCPAFEVLNSPQLCQALRKHYFHDSGRWSWVTFIENYEDARASEFHKLHQFLWNAFSRFFHSSGLSKIVPSVRFNLHQPM